MDNFASPYLLGGILALFLGNITFLIYSFDRPLQGAMSVSPDAFKTGYDQVMKWDE
jgi:hypothetical protein